MKVSIGIVKIILLNFFFSSAIVAYSQHNITINKVEPKSFKKGEPLDNMKATGVLGMAFQNMLDVPDLTKYSSSSTQENYQTPDAYFAVTFQKDGKPLYLGHIYPDGRIKLLYKYYAEKNTKQAPITKEAAGKIAETFVNEKLKALPKQYVVKSISKEKAGKGITPFYIVKIDRVAPIINERKTVSNMVIKVNPTSKEIMSTEFLYK